MTAQPSEAVERIRDAERTRAEILAVATREFADQGYAGARVDEIADKTSTTKRMIYYYFGGKEQLYVAVLEQAYGCIRSLEQQLDVEHLDPVEAIRELAELTFDHHESHPDFIRLVSIENIHRAEHIARSTVLSGLANPALDVLGTILRARLGRRAVPRGRRRARRAPGDQRLLRLPDGEPPHVRRHLRPRPPRPGSTRAPAADARRPRRRLADRPLTPPTSTRLPTSAFARRRAGLLLSA